MSKIRNRLGFTLIEVLIATLITGILTTASFQFFVKMTEQSEAQYEMSDVKQRARTSLVDIKKSLRMAGYKLPDAHPALAVNGDTLVIYRQGTQPVDTIIYFLREYTAYEYSQVPGLPSSTKLWNLMKRSNSGIAQMYSDFVSSVTFQQISPDYFSVSITTHTTRPDYSRETQSNQPEFKTFTLTEQIKIRNLN